MLKFMGACNDHKAALDECFRAEKHEKRRKNFEAAQKRRKRAKELGIDP